MMLFFKPHTHTPFGLPWFVTRNFLRTIPMDYSYTIAIFVAQCSCCEGGEYARRLVFLCSLFFWRRKHSSCTIIPLSISFRKLYPIRRIRPPRGIDIRLTTLNCTGGWVKKK